MDNELKILIEAILDKSKSESNINAQLKQLKIDTLKLNVDISSNQANIKTEIQKITKQANSIISSGIEKVNIPLSFDKENMQNLKVELKQFADEIAKLEGYKEARVTTNYKTSYDEFGNLSERKLSTASIDYYNESNEKALTSTYKLISGTDELGNEFQRLALSSEKASDDLRKQSDNQQKLAEALSKSKQQSLNFSSDIDGQLEDIESRTLRKSKPLLPDSKQFDDYNNKLLETKSKIGEITSQNEVLSDEHKRQINSMVADLKRYSSELQTSAYASDKLKPDTFPNAKAFELKSFDTTSKNWLGNDFINDSFKSELIEAKKLLEQAFDSTGLDEYKSKMKLLGEDFRQLRNNAKNEKFDINLGLDKAKLDTRITAWLNENQKAAKMFGLELKAIQSQINDADKTQLGHLTKHFQGVQTQAKSLGLTGRTVFGELENSAKKFASWLAVGNIVAPLFSGLREVVTNVRELDKALVDLQMATGGTKPQIQQLLNTYTDLGKEIGATTTEVAASANDWLRQGKTIAETNTLIRDSMILSKIGNIDAAKSTEYLTTARNGYNVSVEETIGIVDKLSAVDMISATSAGGLAEGMSEVATNANLAGVSMDKLLGYLAVIGETTGESMSSVGNGLSTMFSRMGNIKLSRLKDYQNGGEDLSNVETVLRGLGVSLRDSDKEFRNFGETLDEVGGNWTNYDDVTQRAIASSIAGKDHMEQFLVLMGNYSKATEYATVATDSAGTALEKMGNYEDSIEASQKSLTASFEGFSSAVLNSGLIKGTFDVGSGILGFLTEVIDKLGIIPAIAATASGALSFQNKGISNVKYAPPYPCGTAA